MRALTSLAASVAIGTSLITATPASAGLGTATTQSNEKGYDAWCGEKGNNCNIVFANGKITVDKQYSVSFKDITYITRNSEGIYTWNNLIRFGIEYQEEGMDEPEFAEILFRHFNTANRFWRDLKRACRQCKDRDATQVEVEVDIKE